MHEFAMVDKIVKIAAEAAEKHGIDEVISVRLRVGKMAAAHSEQLMMGFTASSKGTRLDGARLIVEDVDVTLECDRCSHKFTDVRFDDNEFAHTIAHTPLSYSAPLCPHCGSERSKAMSGSELELVDIEGE